jgi:hypothetical protein
LDRRQKQRDQNPDDGDDDQQLDERKTAVVRIERRAGHGHSSAVLGLDE